MKIVNNEDEETKNKKQKTTEINWDYLLTLFSKRIGKPKLKLKKWRIWIREVALTKLNQSSNMKLNKSSNTKLNESSTQS